MKVRLKSIRVLLVGFALIIWIGGILLWLPISNHSGISFIDAVFTATSAACVTGLVVFDTYSQFTVFGQGVILILIQVGGLGFMMIGVLFFLFMGRRIGLRQRALLMESTGIWKVGG
ncbi:MAG: potassium transporter TrkG, partial [Eubacteriales bacterium]|nr:potassium transporter TrkG [Eubacteriales bacterium]